MKCCKLKTVMNFNTAPRTSFSLPPSPLAFDYFAGFLNDPEQYPFTFSLAFPLQLKSVSTLSAKGCSHPEAGQQGKESAPFSRVNLDGRKAGDPWPRGLGHGDGHLPGLLTEVSTARVLEKRVSKLRLQSNFMEEQPSASPWPRDRLRSSVQHHLHQTHSSWFNTILALQKLPDFPPGSLSKSHKLFLHSISWKCPFHGQHPSLPAQSFRAGGGRQPSPPGAAAWPVAFCSAECCHCQSPAWLSLERSSFIVGMSPGRSCFLPSHPLLLLVTWRLARVLALLAAWV